MKKNKTRQIIISVVLILVDIALFIVMVTLLRWLLIDIVGFDICDYEPRDDFYGGGRVYRFGAGCFEYLFVIIKAAVMILLEKITYTKCKGSKIFFSITIIIHIILFLLCTAYVYSFLDGNNIFWLLRYALTDAEPPF